MSDQLPVWLIRSLTVVEARPICQRVMQLEVRFFLWSFP
ncbi:hypothetical protein HNQ08_003123 [Deinococcus humi]|uniref:Uncharacterized protein n=1 Tax=Deinococcus humi TaxID=662880 RepID=A0A7W8JYC7_9DEIO|nr:hypothetical protein [Deinococcus humi]